MAAKLQPLLDQIKAARERKGLTQRALGDLVGLPQSHISKIENGTVDLQASSLVELARALDLELLLLPRTYLPTVRALRESEPSASSPPEEVDRKLRLLRTSAERLSSKQPNRALRQLISTAADVQRLPLGAAQPEMQQLTATLNEVLSQLRKLEDAGAKRTRKATEAQMRELELSSDRLTRLRNYIMQSLAERTKPAQPAYRLDDSGDDNGG